MKITAAVLWLIPTSSDIFPSACKSYVILNILKGNKPIMASRWLTACKQHRYLIHDKNPKYPKWQCPQEGSNRALHFQKAIGSWAVPQPEWAFCSSRPFATSQQCPQQQGWARQPQISLEKRQNQNSISVTALAFGGRHLQAELRADCYLHLHIACCPIPLGRCLCAEPICAGSKKSNSLEIPGQNAFLNALLARHYPQHLCRGMFQFSKGRILSCMAEVSPPTFTSVDRVILLPIHPPFLVRAKWVGLFQQQQQRPRKSGLKGILQRRKGIKLRYYYSSTGLKGFRPVLPLTVNYKSAEEHCSLT